MSLISDKFHKDKLEKFNINIKTKYIVDNNIIERNTNTAINDDIRNGIICKKEYYKDNKLLHQENIFDSRIEYTFISNSEENKDYTCPNCGMKSKVKDFIDGCPYCGTYYNIDYTEKDLGSKYHYDRVLKNPTYRIITGILDLIISIALSYIFIKTTSRTFSSYDISKIFIYGFILSIILYYFFYILDAYVILSPIKKYKDKENQKQIDFWNRTKIDKRAFFNNLNYEIRKKYYSEPNIIDYDILDYLEFNEYHKNNQYFVKVIIEIRLIKFENNKIVSKTSKETFTLRKNNGGTLELKNGINLIKCHNCGASIDATKGECEYCNSKIKYLQEWIIED